jgi:TRAP-type C4-dicarboxylate transport system permease small subunit
MEENAEVKDSSAFVRIRTLLSRIEEGVLVSLLALMIVLAVMQIFLRNIFEAGIMWADILARILVLWICLVGGMIAARQDRHINIDMISSYLSKRLRLISRILINFVTSIVCITMAWYGVTFVQMEADSGSTAFATVPTWVCAGIIPVAFAVIALRYMILGITDVKAILMLRYDTGKD